MGGAVRLAWDAPDALISAGGVGEWGGVSPVFELHCPVNFSSVNFPAAQMAQEQ